MFKNYSILHKRAIIRFEVKFTICKTLIIYNFVPQKKDLTKQNITNNIRLTSISLVLIKNMFCKLTFKIFTAILILSLMGKGLDCNNVFTDFATAMPTKINLPGPTSS